MNQCSIIVLQKKYDLEYNENVKSNNFINHFREITNKNFVSETMSEFSNSCVGYISGWVIKKLLDKKHTQINCEICRYALIHESQTHDDRI